MTLTKSDVYTPAYQRYVDGLTRDIRAVVERQRAGELFDWDRELADVLTEHMIRVATHAAESVAFGASVGPMVNYLKAVAGNAAKAWNDATREAAGIKADVPNPFDEAANLRAPMLAQTIVAEINSFAKLDTAKRVGKTTKTWLGGKRPQHAAASGQTVPVDQPFSNGLYGPGGPNCHCDLAFNTPYSGQVVEPMRRNDLAIPEDSLSRTRAVSADEYQSLAAEGKNMLARYRKDASPPSGLDGDWASVNEAGWKAVQEEWGGATINAHTGTAVEFGQDKFALTVKEAMQDTVSVPIGASRTEFNAAMKEARRRFDANLRMDKAHLGVFRNQETGMIEFDPVLIVDSRAEVERIGAYTRAKGGAFSFKDGNGYWPPYVEE